MKKIFQKVKSTLSAKAKAIYKDESAQGATEYILLIVVAVALVVFFGPRIREFVQGKVAEIGSGFDRVKVE